MMIKIQIADENNNIVRSINILSYDIFVFMLKTTIFYSALFLLQKCLQNKNN